MLFSPYTSGNAIVELVEFYRPPDLNSSARSTTNSNTMVISKLSIVRLLRSDCSS